MEVDGNVVVPESQFRGKQSRLAFAYLVSERTRLGDWEGDTVAGLGAHLTRIP